MGSTVVQFELQSKRHCSTVQLQVMAQFKFSVLLLSAFLGAISADYIFTVRLASLQNPGQVTVDGRCCVEPADNQTTCSVPCNSTLRICIREEGFDASDFSQCPLTELIVAAQSYGEWRVALPGPWLGTVQVYIQVINDQTGLFEPFPGIPVVGDLIDTIFIQELSLAPSAPPVPPQNYTGIFNIATVEISFSVECTFDFFGPACDVSCPLGRNDSTGRFRCDNSGGRVCLDGYESLETNCTTCIPLDNCSTVGGFCNYPGECICRQGYTGVTCSENDTVSTVTPSPSTSTPSLSSLSTSLQSSLSQSMSTSTASSLSPSQPAPSISRLSAPSISTLTLSLSLSVTQDIPTPSPVAIVTDNVITDGTTSITSGTSMSTSPSVTPPSMGPIPPSSPTAPNIASIPLGSILGILSLMIVVSVVIFVVSLSYTCWKRHKSRKTAKRRRQNRSQPADSVLVNMAAHSHINGSHSDLGQSIEDFPDTLINPTYTTFHEQEDSGAYRQETMLDEGVGSASALEIGTPRKQNLAELEQAIELRFPDVEPLEMNRLGDDLLGSIQQSLSQVGGLNIKRLSANNENLDSVDLGSDYAPSFIYTDMFAEEEDNREFRTPSLSPGFSQSQRS